MFFPAIESSQLTILRNTPKRSTNYCRQLCPPCTHDTAHTVYAMAETSHKLTFSHVEEHARSPRRYPKRPLTSPVVSVQGLTLRHMLPSSAFLFAAIGRFGNFRISRFISQISRQGFSAVFNRFEHVRSKNQRCATVSKTFHRSEQ